MRKQNEIQSICHRRLACSSSQSDVCLCCDIVSCDLLYGGNKMTMLLSDKYIYTPASTDVTIRWKLLGWTPPTQDPFYQKKWADFRKISAAGIESLSEENPLNLIKENDESLSIYQPRSN